METKQGQLLSGAIHHSFLVIPIYLVTFTSGVICLWAQSMVRNGKNLNTE